MLQASQVLHTCAMVLVFCGTPVLSLQGFGSNILHWGWLLPPYVPVLLWMSLCAVLAGPVSMGLLTFLIIPDLRYHPFRSTAEVQLRQLRFDRLRASRRARKKASRARQGIKGKARKFHRRSLAFHLVSRCRRRVGQRPRRLDGSTFPSPICSRHRRWRRRKAKAKARHYRRRVVENEFFLDGQHSKLRFRRKAGVYLSRPGFRKGCYTGRFRTRAGCHRWKEPAFELEHLSDEILSQFCFGDELFSSLGRLISTMDDPDSVKLRQNLMRKYRALLTQKGASVQRGRILQQFASSFSVADHVKLIQQSLHRTSVLNGRVVENCPGHGQHKDPRSLMLIWDTGASFGLTPFRSDFVDYVECDIPVKDVTKVNRVIGIGTTIHKFKNVNHEDVFLPCISYHLPITDVRLFSPQTYHQMHGGFSEVHGTHVVMHCKKQTIAIQINSRETNLPIVPDSFVNKREMKRYGSLFRSALAFAGLSALDFFGDLRTTSDLTSSEGIDLVDSEFEHYSRFCGPCIGADENQNVSGPQKELLLWHWKLGISMYRIQELMREQIAIEPNGTEHVLPPVIRTRHKTTSTCPVPACTSCMLARAKKRSPGVKREKAVPDKEGALSRDKYEPGDSVSADQFNVTTPGRLPTGYGRERAESRFHGGTIYNDAATGIVWVENQVSLGANETVMGKARFEQWLWEQAQVEIKHIHSDNGVFTADPFKNDCDSKNQTQSFSGVGAQHQNARAERAIQTIMYMARTFMVHVSLHWTSNGADDISLWSFAVKHAAWLYNRVPNRLSGMTPLELLTRQRSDHRDLLRAHVWGCPVFVLDPKLQNDQKIPKWNRRSRMGQFLGFSNDHSSLVANVRHLSTGHISPQYHVVFDDLFETVFSTGENDATVDAICNNLFDHNRDWYALEEYNEDGKLIYRPPPLDEVWLTEPERRERKQQLSDQRRRYREEQREVDSRLPDIIPLNTKDDGRAPSGPCVSDDEASVGDDSIARPLQESEGESSPRGAPSGMPTGSPRTAPRTPPTPEPNPSPRSEPSTPPEGATSPEGASTPPRRPMWERDEKNRLRRAALDRSIYVLLQGSKQQPANAYNLSKKRQRLNYKQFKRQMREDGDRLLNKVCKENDLPTVEDILNSPLSKFITLAANDCGYEGSTKELIVNWVHPLFLKAKAEASKEDNPNWNTAMGSEFADEWWKACEVEIETLESMGAWEVVERTAEMNVIRATWAFKLKRYPDGLIKKFKARFCARGDMQLEGVDFFETYAPVVQWTTVRLMLILEVLLGLKSKQGDVTAAFLHADLEPHEKVYVEMPKGFEQYDKRGRPKVLRLRKTLYGLRQSPRAFWKYLVEKMEACGMSQSNFDPCMFVGDRVIAISWVDDILFWAKNEEDINELAMKLRELGLLLEQEEDAAGFLGVNLERDEETGLLEMKQTGLIDRVIAALGLDDGMAKGKLTPAESTPLVKNEEGTPASGTFNYASVVGMLLYLAGHTRPDIAYAVNCCARYMFCPKHSHEQALKRIGRYLKATRTRGLVLNPSSDKCKLDCYPDADFAGMYGHEKPTDPACAKSRTGFVINFADCPVLWCSKLQTETALSTMEAEIIALAHSCRELFPLMDMVGSLGKAVGLPIGNTTMNVSIHEDNAGALVLAKTLPPQFTPRSKYYCTKTIWFREEIVKRGVTLLKIDTVEQLGDMFTKGLARPAFEHLRKKLMGW